MTLLQATTPRDTQTIEDLFTCGRIEVVNELSALFLKTFDSPGLENNVYFSIVNYA